MRIGLNLLHAMPEIGGGWNYITRLVAALGDYNPDNIYVAFVTNKSIGLVPKRPNFETVQIAINPNLRSQRVIYENSLLQSDARKYRLDLMHWFANTIAVRNTVPGVVTVYDLRVFENPYTFPLIKRIYLQLMFSYTVRHATLLLPMSDTTATDLRNTLNAQAERIQVIPAIVPDLFRPSLPETVKEFLRKYNLPNEFWLYVAHFYPHKNHLRLLLAYSELKRNGFVPWPLVLRGDDQKVGKDIKKLVTQLGLEGDVLFLPRLNEGEMVILYSAASALVFPSLYEGGGIPVLEAMACGCPVIASDIPAIREFGSTAVFRFDSQNVSSIQDAMQVFQQKPERRALARQLGIEQTRTYRPERVSEKLIGGYHRASGTCQ